MNNFVIITRHSGAVEWLAQRGIAGPVISGNATPDDVRGKVVVGNVPLHLAALAARVASIDMPALRADQRGADLTPAEMDAAGASINWYVVRDVASIESQIAEADADARETDRASDSAEDMEIGAYLKGRAGEERGKARALRALLGGK